jgi:6-phosphogluconolactonase (cycloisomerase 2 family)
MNGMRLIANCRTTLLGAMPLGLCLVAGCSGGGGGSSTGNTTLPVTGAVTPTVTVTPSAAGSISTAQALSVTVGVTSSSGTPAGSVVLSSGSYASSPVNLSVGQAAISVPAGLLAVGTDALTVNFTPASTATYNSASGTANVTVVASGAAAPVVTASSVMYSTAGYGYPFRALPLASGNVLVSVSAATSGMVVFGPTAGGGLQFSCFNYVRAAFAADGASDFGMNLLPNGLGLAATLGVDGVIFYNLSTLQTCNSTGVQVSQGPVAANEGSFDVAVSPDGKYAFVANEYGVAAGATAQGNIGVVALQYDSTGLVTTGTTLVGQISTGGQTIAGVAISPDGSRLYVTSEVEGAVTTAAGGSNPILTRTGCYQQAGGGTQANGLLTVIDVAKAEANPSTAAIIATVNAGCSPVRAVESADLSTLWVSARGDNRVLAFSTGMLETNPGNALLGYADTGGTAPVGLRLFDKGKLLAVANSNRFGGGTANMAILSVAVPASASVAQTVATGLFPREITVGSDDATLYLTNYSSQSFQVISTTVH